MNIKQKRIITWSARIIALVIILIGLPFYFGYGNPLPFIDSDYSLWKNIVLLMNSLIFIGLAIGWKYEKIAGILITVALTISFFIGAMTETVFSINLLFAIIPGILYLIIGYNNQKTV